MFARTTARRHTHDTRVYDQTCRAVLPPEQAHKGPHLVLGEVSNILGRIARPHLARGNQAARRQHSARSKDTVVFNQGALHENALLPDQDLVLYSGTSENTSLADGDVSANSCGC